jgi:PE family
LLKAFDETHSRGEIMPMVIAEPEMLAAAAAELRALNATFWAGNAAAAAQTTGVVPAASDVVSVLTAAQFVSHARTYQQISAQVAAIREQMAAALGISAGSYAATEAANASAVG